MSFFKRKRELNRLFQTLNPHVGFSAKDLEDLASEKYANEGNAEWAHWSSEVYSFGKWIRKYGFYPSWLPLMILTDHSPSSYKDVPGCNTYTGWSPINTLLVHSQFNARLSAQLWPDKRVFAMRSPTIICKEMLSISQRTDAKGTLVFVSHTDVTAPHEKSNKTTYLQQLQTLPQDMQPIAVCLHWHDIQMGNHLFFLENNIPVFTAGHENDQRFAERFLYILSCFKYSMSSCIGSQMYYSIKMGVPYSVYGQEPIYFLANGKPMTAWWHMEGTRPHSRLQLFQGLHHHITPEQLQAVNEDLSLSDGLSRMQLCKILWSSYLKERTIRQILSDLFISPFKILAKKAIPHLSPFKPFRMLLSALLKHKYKNNPQQLFAAMDRYNLIPHKQKETK